MGGGLNEEVRKWLKQTDVNEKQNQGWWEREERNWDVGRRRASWWARGFWRAILSSVSPQEQLNEHRVCK